MKLIFILGSGGHAREIRAYLEELQPDSLSRSRRSFVKIIGEWDAVFVDDNNPDAITVADYHKMVKSKQAKGEPCYTIIGSGNAKIRVKMIDEIKGELYSIIHPTSKVIKAEIGRGSLIAPGAVVAPHAKLYEHVLVNYNATIGHDCIIGELAVVSPNAAISGGVVIGRGAYIGAGATIREGLKIGEGAVVGMGAVVIENVPPNVIVAGVPAKIIRGNNNG